MTADLESLELRAENGPAGSSVVPLPGTRSEYFSNSISTPSSSRASISAPAKVSAIGSVAPLASKQ